MMYQEFIEICEEIAESEGAEGWKAPTNDQYRVIEEVYIWHPAIENIGGKYQIARIYLRGYTIIEDMFERAKRVEAINIELSQKLKELEALQDELKLLEGRADDIK